MREGVEQRSSGLRLLDALGLDVPARKIVLKHADKTLFRVVTLLGAADR